MKRYCLFFFRNKLKLLIKIWTLSKKFDSYNKLGVIICVNVFFSFFDERLNRSIKYKAKILRIFFFRNLTFFSESRGKWNKSKIMLSAFCYLLLSVWRFFSSKKCMLLKVGTQNKSKLFFLPPPPHLTRASIH